MKKSTAIFVFIVLLFCYTGSVQAFSSILSDFNSRYPGSSSGANASCQLCHGQSTSTWNEYGWNVRQNNRNFSAIEGLPSINNNGGATTFLDEINANTQPGWTTGGNNNLYDSGGFLSDTQTPPGGIGVLDPPTANQPPVADANGDPDGIYFGTIGSPVAFDGSGSSDPDGSIVSYDWNFGDGTTGTGVSPSHTYSVVGTYDVSLTVTDNDGATDTATAMAEIGSAPNVPPTADPNGPYTGTAGIAVAFDGSGSSDSDGSIVSYDWNFGDGATGTGVSPSHTYTASGMYTVLLTVTDDGGATNTDTTTATIDPGTGGNALPAADPNGPYTGTAGIALTFDGSGSSDSDGSIVSYDWDFGDGATGTGVAPSHIYATGGTYTVSLTVTDDGGATGTDTTTATIQNIITGQHSQPSQPDGNITTPEPMKEVEVKVLKTIKRKNRAVTAVKIELVEDDTDLRIADILCGPEGAQLVAPKRLIQKKDGESIAIFRTNDLGIQYDGTQLVCTGTMEPDGTKFMGASNQLTSGDDVNDESNEHVQRSNDDDNNERHKNRDDGNDDNKHHRDDD
jgi:PKD repeat protein